MPLYQGGFLGNLFQAKLPILFGLGGLFGVLFPAYAIPVLNLIPGVQMGGSDIDLFRIVATVYLVAGGLVAMHIRLNHSAHLRHAVTIVLGCVVGIFLARFLWLPESDAATVVVFLVMLVPLLIGSTVSAEAFLGAILYLVMLIGAGTVLQESSFSAPAWLLVLTVTIFGILWGLPLYILGWDWRRHTSKAGTT